MIFAMLSFTYAGVGLAENPYIVSASLFTTPVTQFLNSIGSGAFLGADLIWLMPLFLIFMFAYYGFLQDFLGEGILTLVLVATAIMMMASF
jgi:hypothetical protein